MTSEMGHLGGGTAELIAQADEREAGEVDGRVDNLLARGVEKVLVQ